MPVPLSPLVLVGFARAGRNAGRPVTLSRHVLQLEGACVQQCLLERQELLVFLDTNIASAQPVPVPFSTLVLVGCVCVGGGHWLPESRSSLHLSRI